MNDPSLGTEYEVKCSETWAWYQGFVTDYNESQHTLRVRYLNDWKQPEELDIAQVRYKYDGGDSGSSWRPAINEEVECKARAEENEPYGWWTCKISGICGRDSEGEDQFMVSFIGWGDQHNETLGRSFIRQKSWSKTIGQCLKAKNIGKQRLKVPEELDEWVQEHCSKRTILGKLMPHRNIASQIIHIYYAQQTSYLVLIGVKKVLEAMKKIISCFFSKQKILIEMEKKAVQMERDADRKRAMEMKAEKRTFNIHPMLSGYLRGKQNNNLQEVKRGAKRGDNRFEGKILRIEPMATSCYVAATTKRALEWAIDHLQIVCKKVMIPSEEMGQIIGSKGQLIQSIKASSEVIKVISWSKWEKEFEILSKNQRKYRSYDERERDRNDRSNGYNNTNRDDEGDGSSETVPDVDMHSIFGPDDTIDLTPGFESDRYSPVHDNGDHIKCDHLVIIGRKSRVDLCIFMISMALDSFRAVTKSRNSINRLRDEINRIKGNQPGSPRSPRGGRGRRGRMRGGRGGRGGRMNNADRGGRSDRNYNDRDRSYNDRERPDRNDRGDRNDGDREYRNDRSYNDRNDRDRNRNERRGGNSGGRGRDDRDRGRDRRRTRNQQQGQSQYVGQEEKDKSPESETGNSNESSPRSRRRGNRGGGNTNASGGGRREQYRKKQYQEDGGSEERVTEKNEESKGGDGAPAVSKGDAEEVVDQSQRRKRRRRRAGNKKQENDGNAAVAAQ